nr:Copine domain containing protein [Haemonchus contortus]
MAAFGLELSLRVRNVSAQEAATGVRASIQELYESDNSYIEIAQTETVIGQTNITFQHRCSLNYRFDKLGRLKVSVYCVKDETGAFLHRIGEIHTDVATVLVNRGTLSLPLSPMAAIDVYITVPDFYAHHVKLKFRGNHLQVRENFPLAAYMILVLRIEKRTILLYKSEAVKDKNPKWKEFSVPVYVIQFYTQGALQIHVYNQNTNAPDTLIGFCSTSMAQLERGVGALNSYMLMNFEGMRIHEKMNVELESMEIGRGETFFNAIKESTHLHLTTAIDMTASNGNPNQPDSLHFIHPHAPSPYVNAMLRLTPLFLGYMAHPRIGALGFGARVQPHFELSQCFALSGCHNDPHVDGLKGLLEAYRSAMMAVQPFAPTDFSEVIYHVSKFAKAETRRRLGLYFVLLILTDGGLTNPKRTINAIVDCSLHPMSIIAVGIGKDREFASVKALESPVLKHSDGRPLARQNFQFVPFDDLDCDDAVALIPLQVAQWRNIVSEQA